MAVKRNAYKVLVGKPKGERNTMCTWEDTIKMCLKEKEWEGADWIYLAQDRDQLQALVNMVMNLWLNEILVIS
jgi:hypothetical protein